MMCPASTTVTSDHEIILLQSANVGIESASASAFGLELSGTLLWTLTCYLTAQWYHDFWKMLYCGCLKILVRQRLWLAWWSSSTLWGGCMQHNQEGRLDIVDRLHGLFICWKWLISSFWDSWRSTFMHSLPGLLKTSKARLHAAVTVVDTSMLKCVWVIAVQCTGVYFEMEGGCFQHPL